MGQSPARKGGLLAVAFVLLAPPALHSTHATGALQPVPRPAEREPQGLSPKVTSAALDAEGTVVRRTQEVKVETVDAQPPDAPEELYRVTVKGHFAPRAERYVVVVGGKPVGYGVPTFNQRAVRTIATDPAVLTDAVSVRYDDEPASPIRFEDSGTSRPGRAPLPPETKRLQGGVTRAAYDLGDQVFRPSGVGRRVELVGNVHYPTGLSEGPYPLVLFMHGNHSTCYRKRKTRYQWPCRAGWKPLPNYAGYDYIGRRLAERGFIVVSVSANGVNVVGNRIEDTGMRQRGELLERHMELWRRWSSTGGGPFDGAFRDKVDLSRIGTMGHSRGGEGAVWNKVVDEERDEPFGIDAVLALAPVDFTRQTINNATFAVVLPACDGDVSDLQGVHFFDDSRYAVPGDPTAKHTVTAFGANHNFFNTVWSPVGGYPGVFDDGEYALCGSRLTQWQQRKVGIIYIAGFFRRYLAGDKSIDRRWTGEATSPPIAPARTLVSYLAPDTATHRMDLARFTSPADLSTNQLGGEVTPSGLSRYGWCANKRRSPCVTGAFARYDRHMPGLSEGLLGWNDRSGVLRFEIPGGRGDVTRFDAFQFRAAVNPGYKANRNLLRQDLAVRFIDGAGRHADVLASAVGNKALANPFEQRRWPFAHILLNQVRWPLGAFEGVDLSDIQAVELRTSGTRNGVINIADVAFSRAAD